MAYIFLDESGDLGFDFTKSRTSKYFVITCLFVDEKRPIEKLVSKIHESLRKIHKKRGGVLHSHEESPTTRTRLLKQLVLKNCKIMVIYLNKRKVYTNLREEKSVLYNYVTNILLDRIYSKKLIPTNLPITLIASRKETNKFLNENFKNYLSKNVDVKHKSKLEVVIKTPHEEKALQAVDFVSWSIFRRYEYGDEDYYQIIKPIISEESPLFP